MFIKRETNLDKDLNEYKSNICKDALRAFALIKIAFRNGERCVMMRVNDVMLLSNPPDSFEKKHIIELIEKSASTLGMNIRLYLVDDDSNFLVSFEDVKVNEKYHRMSELIHGHNK